MCGIIGFNWKDQKLIKRMTDSLQHRGPDSQGLHTEKNLSLGHRRLSILDLSEKGNQPMQYKNLIIVHNGEIYNFRELREELKRIGHTFKSQTDTEVILHSYSEWGENCLEKFNGMWAFCIYDKNRNTLFLSRDRFGIKPLYYYFNGEKFIFSSELKAILLHKINLKINNQALNFFFYQKYIGGNQAIFENCYKILPSQNISFDLNKKTIKKNTYFHLEKCIQKYKKISVQTRIMIIKETLLDAVEKRLISDVPIGAFLSGGVDSSLISGIIAKKHRHFDTFSIGFKSTSYDEVKFSKIVSKHIKTKHHYKYLQMDKQLIKFVIENMDEPLGDPSVLPTYLLSKITKQNVTVSLSGDGGDEIFAGYDAYQGHIIARYIPKFTIGFLRAIIGLLPPSDKKLSIQFKMKRFVRNSDQNINTRHLNWMATFIDKDRKNLLRNNFISSNEFTYTKNRKDLTSIQLNDIHNYMAEDILKKVDLASMLNSLEVRVPFLDHRLVPVVLSLPDKYKIRFLKTKWILKKIAKSYLPNKIINRRKKGFTVPISQWIKQSNLIKDYLTQNKYYKHNKFDKKYVLSLLNSHIRNKKDNSRQLWLIFVFNYWFHNTIKDGIKFK